VRKRRDGAGFAVIRSLVVGAALVLALAACGGGASPSPSIVLPASPSSGVPASPVDGAVVAIDSAGLAAVRGFTLRLAGGAELSLKLGTLENGDEFAPGHLKEHMALAETVRVWFRVEGGMLVAYRLDDAP